VRKYLARISGIAAARNRLPRNDNTSPVGVCVVGRGRQSFRERDVTRAVKAVTKAGVPVARVMIDKGGNIVVIAGEPAVTENNTANELDKWMAKHHAR
jgi:hypothetical protein